MGNRFPICWLHATHIGVDGGGCCPALVDMSLFVKSTGLAAPRLARP